MNKTGRNNKHKDIVYPFDQIYEARADFTASFSEVSKTKLKDLRNKCEIGNSNNSDRPQSIPFAVNVDFKRQLDSTNAAETSLFGENTAIKVSAYSYKKNSIPKFSYKDSFQPNLNKSELSKFQFIDDRQSNFCNETDGHDNGKEIPSNVSVSTDKSENECIYTENQQEIVICESENVCGKRKSFIDQSHTTKKHSVNSQIHSSRRNNGLLSTERSESAENRNLYYKNNRSLANDSSYSYSRNNHWQRRSSIEEQHSASICRDQTPELESDGDESAEPAVKVARLMKTNALQCDHCDFNHLEMNQMQTHLKIKQHYSASLTEGIYNDKKFTPSCVVKESYLINNCGKYKDIVPICPKCDNIFPTIYMCALHHTIHHDKFVTNVYQLSKVLHDKPVIIPVQNFICKTCNTNNLSQPGLLCHWLTNGHSPYNNPDSGCIVYFICEYCDTARPFYKFSDAVKHMTKSHGKQHTGGEVYLMARYLKRTGKSEFFTLPRAQMTIQQQLQTDLKTLKKMTQACNRCNTEKQNKVTKLHIEEIERKLTSFHT